MSDTKTTTTAAAPKTIKTPVEAIHDLNEASRKVALAYVEAHAEMGKSIDAMARVAMNHFMGASKESVELGQSAFEASAKARETARKAGIELIERSFAIAGK
jgi:hypothetical protein